MLSERDFYNCPYCKSAKDGESGSVIGNGKRVLKITYQCGTEIKIEFSGANAKSSWSVKCGPRKDRY